MPKAITLGNGHLLVGLDGKTNVRELYYPFVGLENHISGASGSYAHRIGVWVDGVMSWLDEEAWAIDISTLPGTAIGVVHAVHSGLGVEVTINDAVHNEKNVFVRWLKVHNVSDSKRTIKIYFAQQFRIAEDSRGSTGFFDPRVHAVIHYKRQYTFLVNASINNTPFDDYTIGLFGMEGKNGSHHDTEDGMLTKNPIEHGSVDSVLGLTFEAKPHEIADVHYWLVAADSISEAHDLNSYVLTRTPILIHKSVKDYWQAWATKAECNLAPLEQELRDLYYESLIIVRAHTDARGAIIASSDSDMLQNGRDTYSYVWPRDASLSAFALDRAGYNYITQEYYRFCDRTLMPEGYFMHKYCSDGTLGSSWHSWVQNGKTQLPIQLDETALVIYCLGKHYECVHDLEFIESIYNTLIERASDFLCEHIDEKTHLPKDTFDLWEEKYGSSTYSAAATSAALLIASTFAEMLGKREEALRYKKTSENIKKAILEYLWDEELGMFVKLYRHEAFGEKIDRTIDISSFHGVVSFDILPPDDKRVLKAYDTICKTLRVPTEIGGFIRYEGDQYFRIHNDAPSNPWFITTLWMAQYEIKAAVTQEELVKVKEWLWWTAKLARKTGVLSEQLNSFTGEHISTAPLTWSHAEYIHTVHAYTERYFSLPLFTEVTDSKEVKV